MVLLTQKTYHSLLKLYLSDLEEIPRKEFCYIIGISQTDHSGYTKVINLLEEEKIVLFKANIYGYSIIIDKKALGKLIFSTENYILGEKARKKSITKFGIIWE